MLVIQILSYALVGFIVYMWADTINTNRSDTFESFDLRKSQSKLIGNGVVMYTIPIDEDEDD